LDFIPHTAEDDRAMLAQIGLEGIDDLFEPIPRSVRLTGALDMPGALSEPELVRHLDGLARRNRGAADLVCFAGGGAYDHHVPAVVQALAGRAEFSTSYTPYQAELSQGVLQALYEFQTLICELYGLEVANASLYDGANALVEAVGLAVRKTGRRRVLVGSTVHPHYVDVLRTYTSGIALDIEVVEHAAEGEGAGAVEWSGVDASDSAAVVAQSPSFLGRIEDLGAAATRAHRAGALMIAVSDPTAMGVLAAPGDLGADVVVGEGHALGNPLSYGGPYVGLFATKQSLVRQVPGRISGATSDMDGRRAFVLTLQAREQHIRRSKATSNVCTNQTLMAIAAAVHLCWLGPQGLQRLGEVCVRRTAFAAARLAEIPGCALKFPGPRFKELVLELPVDASGVVSGLARRGFLAGPALGPYYEGLGNCLLVAVTEQRTEDDIQGLAEAVEKELAER
jgi:glycine cleavage system P protein (glycine dehydrogenase) subunit 1